MKATNIIKVVSTIPSMFALEDTFKESSSPDAVGAGAGELIFLIHKNDDRRPSDQSMMCNFKTPINQS
jgi:hypothetical protein